MILRGIHVEHWRCIAQLDLDDLPLGIVVLHGPNRTGKSSLVKALRGCLFDFDHDSTKAELRSCHPWNNNGPPKLAVEFETAGERYRITKVYSKRSDGRALLEQQCQGGWRILDDSPKEAARRTRELLGADRSNLGLNQLLWLDQGDIYLPDIKDLDGSLERQLVGVLGVMVTGRDLGFKQQLDKRYERWFGVTGKHKPTSPVNRWEEETRERLKKRDELLAKLREIEQAIFDMESCEGRLPELEKAAAAAGQEWAEREQEREQTRERRQQHRQAHRDVESAQQQLAAAQGAWQSYQEARERWQEAEARALRAELAQQATRAEKDRRTAEQSRVASELQAARREEEESRRNQEELEERRKLFQLAERHARRTKVLERARQLEERVMQLQQRIRETVVPDKETLETLRENRQTASKYRVQLHAAELSLRITLRQSASVQLRLDDALDHAETPPAGASLSWTFRQHARVELPELGSIEIQRSQDDNDLGRVVAQLAKLDRDYHQAIAAFREQPDEEGCLDRLTERWLDREAALAQLAAVHSELQQVAPYGSAALEAEAAELESQRRIILERRPDLADWLPSEVDLEFYEQEFRARNVRLLKSRRALEAAEKQASEALQIVQTTDWEDIQKAVAARTTARNAREELQRLGDDLSLQTAVQRADEQVAQARQRLQAAELNEAEQTVEQRSQAAQQALLLRQERLQQLKDEMNRHRGRLEGSEGLHTQLADAEAAVQEAEEMLAREQREADAHKHLRELFEASREHQVERVMGPIGGRVLRWTQSLGLNEYREVRFGDRFLPEGLILRHSDLQRVHPLGEESYGTGEQLGLLIRLAIGGVLAKDEPAVTILDDPLAHADAAKHRRILDLMRMAAEGNLGWTPPAGRLQILIFTCHPDRFDYLTGVRQIDLAKQIVREA